MLDSNRYSDQDDVMTTDRPQFEEDAIQNSTPSSTAYENAITFDGIGRTAGRDDFSDESGNELTASPPSGVDDDLYQDEDDEAEEIDDDEEIDEQEEIDDDDALYVVEKDTTSGQLDDTDSESRARFVATAADSLRGSDITVLDLRGLTIIADFFVVCTGKSSIQIRGIADRIEERMREEGYRKLRVEGYQEATWILLDYGDVVAHIMAEEQREFYSLEKFWQSAPRLELVLDQESSTIA